MAGALQRCLQKLDGLVAPDAERPSSSTSSRAAGGDANTDETAWVRTLCALLQHAASLSRASDFLEQVLCETPRPCMQQLAVTTPMLHSLACSTLPTPYRC